MLTGGVLRSERNPGGVRVGSSERIVDLFVLGAAGSAVRIFVVLVIPRFGHVYLQAQSAAYQGTGPGLSGAGPMFEYTGYPPALRASSAKRSRLWAVVADINMVTMRYSADQRKPIFAGQR